MTDPLEPTQSPQAQPASGRAHLEGCFSSLGCPQASLDEAVRLAARFELPCLELRTLEGRTDLPALLASRPGGWEAARKLLLNHGICVRVLGTSFKLVGHQNADWQELFDFAALADALDAPYLRVFGGGKWGTPVTASDEEAAVKAIVRWRTERRERGFHTDILIETHDAFSASPPCLRLLEMLETPVQFIWDSHHTWRLGGESPAESWRALGPHVRHVHIKDSIDRPSARHPYTYVLPGTGQMPGLEVRAVLERAGYRGAVSLEWEKMWHPYLPELAEALSAARALHWH